MIGLQGNRIIAIFIRLLFAVSGLGNWRMSDNNLNPYKASSETPIQNGSHKESLPKTRVFKLTLFLICIGTIFLCIQSSGFLSGLVFVPFALGPLLINLSQSNYWRSAGSQVVLLVASVAYAIWFSYFYAIAIVWGTDAQSPTALMFIGIYSMPIMVPLWIVAGVLDWRSSRTGAARRTRQGG
jgi:hypothetical protein